MSEIRLASIAARDLPAVAAIHEVAFRKSALGAFGPTVIRRYYDWLLSGPHDARLVGAWQGSSLVGFCAGGVFRGAMNGFLRKNRRYLALNVLKHPRLLMSQLVRDRMRTALTLTVRYSRVLRSDAVVAPSFGILAIATDPRVRGHGAGRALMLEAEERARSNGFERMVLTVHPDNSTAITFYECLGWSRYGTGPWTGTMEKRF